MSPGLEPVLLDLENLFWLSDEGNSTEKREQTKVVLKLLLSFFCF